MEDAFVRLFDFVFGLIGIAGGIFAYNNEKTDPRHADCGVIWKVVAPGFLFIFGISLVIFVVVWI